MPTASSVLDRLAEHNAQLARQVFVSNGHLVLDVDYEYSTPLDRCASYEQILGCLHHLCEKTWMTPSIARRFILLACLENGLKVPHP